MLKEIFYNVHKDFAQNGPIYGHEEYLGLTENQALAKYHELLASAYQYNDSWVHVYIMRDDGINTYGEKIDRRIEPEPEPILEPNIDEE